MPTVAYRVTRSRRKFIGAPKVKGYLAAGMEAEVKPHFIQRFKGVVSNWKHAVDFKARKYIQADSIRLNVYPAGPNKQIWIWVSGGTKGPYPIPKHPSPGRRLAFKWGGPGSYKAKTGTGGKIGGPGVVVGGSMHYPRQVKHPGIKAREFEKTIAEDEKAWFSRTMNNIWRRAIRQM